MNTLKNVTMYHGTIIPIARVSPRYNANQRVLGWKIMFLLVGLSLGLYQQGIAQNCSNGNTPTVLASWTFDAGSSNECFGAIGNNASGSVLLYQDVFKYCPTTNAGCGKALLGSKGHSNTKFFVNALCVSDFYLDYSGLGTATSWQYNHPKNLRVTYDIPVGKIACLSSMSLNIMGNKGMNGFGVTVLRNGIPVNTQTFAPTVGVRTINWSGSDFCTDGSQAVSYTIYFGFWGTTNNQEISASIGFDDIYLNGTCGGPPTFTLTASPSTCDLSGAIANGSIKVSDVLSTALYQYSLGSTFNAGTATPATPTVIPLDGIITATLPNPSSNQPYTVRVYDNATSTCYTDQTVILPSTSCPPACVQPTNITLTPVEATCISATTANNDAQIQVTGVTNGDKIGISTGTTYTGPAYSSANNLPSGVYTFTNLNNPICGSQVYTVRVFNTNNTCYIDKQVEVLQASCTTCQSANVVVLGTGSAGVLDANTVNNTACYEACKGPGFIDLNLTKTVNPLSGTVCGTSGTDFVWTLTLTNEGTMTAKNIQVSDLIPDGLTLVSSNPTAPNFTLAAGWQIDSLQAGQNTVLTLTTKALKAGSYTNCAQVSSAFPLNDPDSTPGNNSTTEDDDACATITVTGDNPPSIAKEFSPWEPKTNSPFRLMLKITNNQTVPITLTQDFVDAFPSSPSQMVVASTPNISTQGMTIPVGAVLATANGTSVTIPKGTVLLPGLNQVFVDVNVTSDGIYCNDIAANALQTTGGSNCLTTQACVAVASTNNIPPIISKKFASGVANTNTDVLLTITIENRNASAMTLDQDFYDILPSGMVMGTGTNTGTCTGVAPFTAGDTLVKIVAGTVIPSGICTVIVPIRSTTSGQYQNRIYHNSMLITVNGESNLGSRGLADGMIEMTSTPCTTIDVTAITANPVSPFAAGSAVTLTPTITGAGASTIYQWSATPTTGDAFYANTGVSPAIWTPTSTGTYTLKLVVDNSLTGFGTCKDSITLDVVVQGTCVPPVATATPSTQTICNGSTPLAYTATPSTGVEYKWYGPLADTTSGLGTAISGATTAVYTPSGTDITTTGKKYYAVVLNNTGNTTCSDTAFVALTVNPLPSTPSVSSPINNICPLTTVDLTTISSALAPSVVGGIFEWHVSNSSSSALVSNQNSVVAGDYYLFEKSPTGCYSIGSKVVVNIQVCCPPTLCIPVNIIRSQ